MYPTWYACTCLQTYLCKCVLCWLWIYSINIISSSRVSKFFSVHPGELPCFISEYHEQNLIVIVGRAYATTCHSCNVIQCWGLWEETLIHPLSYIPAHPETGVNTLCTTENTLQTKLTTSWYHCLPLICKMLHVIKIPRSCKAYFQIFHWHDINMNNITVSFISSLCMQFMFRSFTILK